MMYCGETIEMPFGLVGSRMIFPVGVGIPQRKGLFSGEGGQIGQCNVTYREKVALWCGPHHMDVANQWLND